MQNRIMLMVKVRWLVLIVLAFFGVLTTGTFSLLGQFPPGHVLFFPLFTTALAIVFNMSVAENSETLPYLKHSNQAILVVDILIVTTVIHLSGGVYSWLWCLYLMVSLEAAILLGKKHGVWFMGFFGNLAYALLVLGELIGVLPHYSGQIRPIEGHSNQ
jgi:hypothetical protein